MISEPMMAQDEEELHYDPESSKASSKPSVPEIEEPDFGVSIGIFWHNVGLAIRCGVFCVIAAIPILVPSLYNAMDTNWATQIGPIGILLLVFTLYGNLGLTNQLAWQGFMGTGVACAVTHVMCAIMPLGARHPDTYNPYIAHTVNVLAIFFGLWLNTSNNFRLFYVCYQCYFYMEFVNPNSVVIYNTSWAINWDSYLVTTLCTTAYGAVLAIICMVLPYPIRASNAAKGSALSTVNSLNKLMDFCVDYYNGQDRSVKIFQGEGMAVGLRNAVQGMGDDIDGMWWEGFDKGRSGQSRELLGRHLGMMKDMVDNVFALQVAISKEDFGESHIECMQAIKPAVSQLMIATKTLLSDCTASASDGDIDEGEKQKLTKGIENAHDALGKLAGDFDSHRQAKYAEHVINGDLQAEHFFCFCLSRYCRLVIDYTEDMINDKPKPKGICKELCEAFLGTFDKHALFVHEGNRNFLIRGTISILICFYFGFYFLSYAGVPSGTGALLLNKFSGAAIQKNLGRLQAVLISQVVPHLIVAVLGTSCNWVRIGVQALAMIGWELITCYVYYTSTTYGYIGCLTAAFGIPTIAYPCAAPLTGAAALAADTAFQVASFTKLVQTTMAIIILTSVDLVLATDRASTLAIDNIKHAYLAIDAGLQAVFGQRHTKGSKNGAVKSGQVQKRPSIELTAQNRAKAKGKAWKLKLETGQRAPGFINDLLVQSEFFGGQAALEPRYWMAPWSVDYYDTLLRSGYLLRADLLQIERALLDTKGKYHDLFEKFRGSEAFQRVGQDLTDTMADCMFLVQGILANDTKKPMGEQLLSKMNQCEGVDELDAMGDLWDQINTSDLKYPPTPPKNLEDDEICRLNVTLMMMESAIETIAGVIRACIKEA